MDDCSRLRSFPDISSNIKHLHVKNTKIKDVSASVAERWLRLEEFLLGSKYLKRLTHVPKGVRYLDLSNSDIKKIPDCIIGLPGLQRLRIKNCRKLVSLQGLPPSLRKLDAEDCVSLKSVCFSFCEPKSVEHTCVALEATTSEIQFEFSCNSIIEFSCNSIISEKIIECGVQMLREEGEMKISSWFDDPNREVRFLNCMKLDEEARRAIIQRWAYKSVCFPGKEIPSEFTHKATGNSITIPEGTLPLSSSFKYHPPLRTEHLFIFPGALFKEDRWVEVDSDIQFEFICNEAHSKIVECGVQIMAEEGETSSREWKQQSDGAVKHTGCWSGLKKLVGLKKKKHKTE
ncbi:LRR-like disease resistance protein [Raphanus sativus]|nr:LRR-like disease resistance protein [Raphanus sativus]